MKSYHQIRLPFWKWLTTLKVFVVGIDDYSNSPEERLVSIHFTQRGALRKIAEEGLKRWQFIQVEGADKWLVRWIIKERIMNL